MKKFYCSLILSGIMIFFIDNADAVVFSDKAKCSEIVKNLKETKYKSECFGEDCYVTGLIAYYDRSKNRCYAYIITDTNRDVSESIIDALNQEILASSVFFKGKPEKTWIGNIYDKSYRQSAIKKFLTDPMYDPNGYYAAQAYINEIRKLQ